jgi:hypothetical protein
MPFGAGHIQDMNNRIKQNLANRPSNRKRFKENEGETFLGDKKPEKPLEFIKPSAAELEKILLDIRAKSNRKKKKQWLINGIIFLTIVLLLYKFFPFLFT